MRISADQMDNVIKAYSKHIKARLLLNVQQNTSPDRYVDLVTLSGSDSMKVDVDKKISNSLLDILRKGKMIAP